MSAVKIGMIAGAMAVAVAISLWLQQQAGAHLRGVTESLLQQAEQAASLRAENRRLSNSVALIKSSQALSDTEFRELMKLRNDVGQLRRNLKELGQLQKEVGRIREAIKGAEQENEEGGENPTALLVDEWGKMQARVVKMRAWLELHPEEKIPELQFLTEENWVHSANSLRVTDEDYRLWMSAQRSNGERVFGNLAYKALKQYSKDSGGQFPTDLNQLKPYFAKPVEDAVLDRYEIVRANSLAGFLAKTGDEWVITQKAPVNKQFDSRFAIGLKQYHGTVEDGRWDPPQ